MRWSEVIWVPLWQYGGCLNAFLNWVAWSVYELQLSRVDTGWCWKARHACFSELCESELMDCQLVCGWGEKKKKKTQNPTKMQICIIWLQPREGWCNISVTEHSRSNIFRLISVSKRNSSLITFVKICFKHLHLKDLFIYFK